ncbi:hypothetical protein SRHO_G00127980 [Serrasalmus rhombeus]
MPQAGPPFSWIAHLPVRSIAVCLTQLPVIQYVLLKRLDLNMELPQGQTGAVGTSVASAEQDELPQQLFRLRDQI